MKKDDWIKKNKEESHHVSILMQRIAELEKGLESVKNAYCEKDSECRQLKGRIAELGKEADRLSNNADELRKIHVNRIAELEKRMEVNFVSKLMAENTDQKILLQICKEKILDLEKQLDLHKNAHHKCVEMMQEKQTKPLSDEDILDLWVKKNKLNGASDIIEFAREIRGEK